MCVCTGVGHIYIWDSFVQVGLNNTTLRVTRLELETTETESTKLHSSLKLQIRLVHFALTSTNAKAVFTLKM